MINKWFNGFIKVRKVAGIELVINTDGSYYMSLVVLEKVKQRVITIATDSSISKIEEFQKIIDKDTPICLSISGKGVIHKKIEYSATETDKQVLNKVLPNANVEEFYLQRIVSAEGSTPIQFASVIRKNILDVILADFKTAEQIVVKCSVGPFDLTSILPLLFENNEAIELTLPFHQLEIIDKRINNYVFNLSVDLSIGESIHIAGDHIKRAFLVPFSSTFNYLVGNEELLANNINSLSNAASDFLEKKKFKFIGWALLSIFLGILLINYLVFNSYWTKEKGLQANISISKGVLDEYEKLKNEITEKDAFFEKSGLLESSKISYYADNLVLDLPKTIQLTELYFNPLMPSSNLEETKKMEFSPKKIVLSGYCKMSSALNEWISIIKKKTWVKQLNLINYTFDKENDAGAFKIEITIN